MAVAEKALYDGLRKRDIGIRKQSVGTKKWVEWRITSDNEISEEKFASLDGIKNSRINVSFQIQIRYHRFKQKIRKITFIILVRSENKL